jgi:hypothetical protein
MKFTGATKFHRKSGGGPTAKRQPSPEGLGNDSEEDPSAVPLGAQSRDLKFCGLFVEMLIPEGL